MLNYLWLTIGDFYAVPPQPFRLADVMHELRSRRISYGNDVVAVGEDIECAKVVAVWPEVGSAAVAAISDHIDPHWVEEISNPRACLRPVESWPARTPRSKVFAQDREWYETVRAAVKRGMMAPVSDSEIFKNQHGVPV